MKGRKTSIYKKAKLEYRKEPTNSKKIIALGKICYKEGKFDEAVEYFSKILSLKSNFNSFEELNREIKKLASEKRDSNLDPDLRIALLYIGLILHEQGKEKVAEDFILNASYKSNDPKILLVSGKYYLEKYDAEINTGLAYFKSACEIDRLFFPKCDALWNDFLKRKKIMYPISSIKPYIDFWDEFRKKFV